MQTYYYTAVSRSGEQVKGVIDGFNEMDAAERLKENYTVILKLKEVKPKSKVAAFLSEDIGGKRLNDRAFTMMCTQFAVILEAGIPVVRAARLIARKMTDKTLKRVLEKVAEDVEAGRSLSASFAESGNKLLPVTFLETIRAGEESGTLDQAFRSASQHYTKQIRMRGKVRGALIYPAFVLLIAIAVVIVLMVKVVPTFTAIFDSYGASLPLITRSLIAISEFFRDHFIHILIVVLAAVIVFKLYGNTENGRLRISRAELKLPVLGNIHVLNAASQFANTMTMMLEAGLPITRAVTITSRVLSNYSISKEVGKMTSRLETGHTLSGSMREAGCLPDILTDMTAVGEESGELARTMSMTADYYDSELEQATAAALAKLEPAILVFMGALVGYIVAAIYIAMFSMYGAL